MLRPKRLVAAFCAAIAVWCGHAVAAPAAEIVIENEQARLVIGRDGTWRSLVDRRTGKEWCYARQNTPLAHAYVDGRSQSASGAAWDGQRLRVVFGRQATTLVYRVEPKPNWIVFRLESVLGQRPTRVLTLLRVPVAITENVGPRLNIAWNDEVSICLIAANTQTYGSGGRRGEWADLRAYTQDAPGPKLEGAAVALILCPTADIRKTLHKASVDFGLLANTRDRVPAKELPEAKQSYWFMALAESDADKMVEYCHKTGFRQVMLGFGSWGAAVGHYTFRTANYPDGKESLKRFVDKLHAAGILVGMHTFASKVSKRDAYVTPVPDKRFWKDMETRLADSVTPDQTEIRVQERIDQWPGSPVCKKRSWEGGVRKHQEVILDDEIVQFDTIGPDGKWDTFLGCKRGAWGTKPAAHKAGTMAYHYGVDGCINGYIIDQETDLLDEATANLAEVFNYCGFDMVYFDGGEDVDRRRFNYYASKHQEAAMRKFNKRPIVHCGTVMTHRLWHSFARSGTVDVYVGTLRGHIVSHGAKWLGDFQIQYPDGKIRKWRTVKEHIDLSVRRAIRMRQDLMPSELGWFGIWPKSKYSDGLQLDEAEYLMVRSLAYGVPISLQTSFRRMEAHPLTPQILQIVKVYEQLRAGREVDEATRAKLREPGKDFILVQGDGPREFVEVQEMPKVAGTHDVRALVGERAGGVIAVVWHYFKDGKLTLMCDPRRVRAANFMGEPIPVEKGQGRVTLPVNSWRTTLFFEGDSIEAARARLATSLLEVRQPVKIWLQAEEFGHSEGNMAKGSAVGVREPQAFGDVILCTSRANFTSAKHWYCEYKVDIPRAAQWTFWGRVRYPSGTDESFGLVPAGEEVTLKGSQVFGNCGVNEKKWHWTGRGGGSTAVPPGAPITLKLPRGPFTFRIYAREAGGRAQTNPRLDCICICDERDYMPTDEDAKAALR